jgi:hypothetical protein
MSKLVARLDRVSRGVTRSLGFATQINQESISTLVLVAWIEGANKKEIGAIAKTKPDAVVISSSALGTDDLERRLKPLDGSTWGVIVGQPDRDTLQQYRDTKCDFLVFGIEGMRVDFLGDGECARVLRVPADLEEYELRGLEDLPIDIVILYVEGSADFLTLRHMLSISNVRSATGRYMLLEWGAELTTTDLEHLREIGLDGIVIKVGNVGVPAVSALRETIDSLPPRKNKGEYRSVAVLPRMIKPDNTPPHRHEEEEGDEEEM